VSTLRKRSKTLVVLVAVAIAVAVVPAVASANTAWVSSTTPVKSPFNSCANPGFSSIQAAINSPSTAIHVCSGAYKEQLQIKRPLTLTGEAGAIVQLPPSPEPTATACDVAESQDLLVVCVKGVVKIASLTLEARWTGVGDCAKELFGVMIGGEATVSLSNSTILHAGTDPITGCQQGVGIQIGRNRSSQVGVATLTNDTIEGYQKNGITADGPGSKATVKKVTVKGGGPLPIGQNGIQVSRGAVGKITESSFTGNECSVASCGNANAAQLEEDGAGVLFYKQAPGSSVATSTISENDLGVSHISSTETGKPQTTIINNSLVKDRYAAVMIGQGYAAVNKDKMEEGSVGILVLQFAGQEFGPKGTGAEDTITGMSKYAIEGLSDNQPADQFGSFTISKSKISGNPPLASVQESVFTNNPEKLKIFLGAGNT
jgi:nitrous oxidase accessory protein NosD